MLHSAWTPRY